MRLVFVGMRKKRNFPQTLSARRVMRVFTFLCLRSEPFWLDHRLKSMASWV